MNIKTLKQLFDAGLQLQARISKTPLSNEWEVIISGGMSPETLETARGETRSFKNLESAVNACRQIGFKQALVTF